MNANRIKQDGFSNPETQHSFFENWTDDRLFREGAERKHCGFCVHSHFLGDPMFILCLNADSPYCYESLDATFTCQAQATSPDEDDEPGR